MNEVHGFKELDRALGELPKAIGKNALRRVGKRAMKRIEDGMTQRAPREEGTLAESMRTQEVKAKRQRGQVRFDPKTSIEFITGPAPEGRLNRANAGWQEYGTVHHGAQPFMRPAFDGQKERSLDIIRKRSWEHIQSWVLSREVL